MKKMLYKAFSFLGITAVLLGVFAGKISADYGCVPVYGGGVECPKPGQFVLNKKVLNPSTGVYVDNLGLLDPKYRPQQIVTFQINITNSGDQNIDWVTITDKFPQYVDFMSGPGNFNTNTRQFSFTVNNLASGTMQTFIVTGRVSHPMLLPSDKNIECLVNVIDAGASTGQNDHDESQFCIEKQPQVPTVPQAGPEHWILSFAGLTTVFITGIYLRKKTILAK